MEMMLQQLKNRMLSPWTVASPWSTAVSNAIHLIPSDARASVPSIVGFSGGTTNFSSSEKLRRIAFTVREDMGSMSSNIKRIVESKHPVLKRVSQHYFQQSGKQLTPLIVLLISQATSSTTANSSENPITNGILPAQKRLAEISEMLHTASLLHDDVIDESLQRRHQPTANANFGNKMAILAGDYLLSKVSLETARIGCLEVIEETAEILSNLVEGEFMQLSPNFSRVTSARSSEWADVWQKFLEESPEVLSKISPPSEAASSAHSDDTDEEYIRLALDYYIQTSFMKTASLISSSCRSACLLRACPKNVTHACYKFGQYMGIAYQIIDDVLDYSAHSNVIGKPAGVDISLGVVTAPALFAACEFPAEMTPLIRRQFKEDGDGQLALHLVHESAGLERSKRLATLFVHAAVESISILPKTDAKDALISLAKAILTREK